MQTLSRRLYIFLLVLVAIVGVLVRCSGLLCISGDMKLFLLPWFNYIVEHDGYRALSQNFANYTPPYLYLLTLATYFYGGISPVIRIKLISIFFDFGLATVMHELVRQQYGRGVRSLLAWAATLGAPTTILNSSYWGQSDAIYTTFLLACVYFICKHQGLWAMIFFSLALAFKSQAVFLAPFLAVFFLRGDIPWRYVSVPGIVYFLSILPSALLGRPIGDLLTIYFRQAGYYPDLCMSAPNLYIFCAAKDGVCTAQSAVIVAFILTVSVASVFVIRLWNSRAVFSSTLIIVAAAYSAIFMPFLLPRMHDRYFYPADILSIAIAFYQPRLWWLPLMFQISSLLAYSGYLWGASPLVILLAALINLVSLLFLSLYMWNLTRARVEVLAA